MLFHKSETNKYQNIYYNHLLGKKNFIFDFSSVKMTTLLWRQKSIVSSATYHNFFKTTPDIAQTKTVTDCLRMILGQLHMSPRDSTHSPLGMVVQPGLK